MKILVVLCCIFSLSGCLLYRTDNGELSFFKPYYMDRDRVVTKEDLQILTRATEILSNETQWNRKGNRLCFYDAKWSLFCALAKASVEVTGVYKHRRVAMQETRFTINDKFPIRWKIHQLMDFNNHEATRFSDIKSVLEETRMRLERRYQNK